MIDIEGVTVSFGRPVLRALKTRIDRNQVVALIGPPASGKSTLLKALTGLVDAPGARIEVGGENIVGASLVTLSAFRKRIGMLFQNVALFGHLDVGENIAFPLRRLFSLSEREIAERVDERLARVALAGFERRMPTGLSGGQRKRVGIARATVAKPEYVLYDEPAAGLDPVTTQKIFNLIRDEQRAQQSTVIVVSSDVKNVLRIADRVLMLHEGDIVFDAPLGELPACAHPVVRQFVDGRTEGPL